MSWFPVGLQGKLLMLMLWIIWAINWLSGYLPDNPPPNLLKFLWDLITKPL